MKLQIDESVWQDLKQAIHYYETEANQGEKFKQDFYEKLQRIKENPYLYIAMNTEDVYSKFINIQLFTELMKRQRS